MFCIKQISDDAVDVLFIKTKYVKGRHFVATNCCFFNSSQKRKQTSLLKSTDVNLFRGSMSNSIPTQMIHHLVWSLSRF